MSDAVPVPEILTPDVDTPTEEPSLSAEINKTTRDLHDIVNVLIMNRLSSCLKSRDHTLYREGILSFYHVYRTFEHVWASLLLSSASTDLTVHYLLSTLSDPRMIRSPALAADCSYLFPDNTFHPDAPVPENRPQVKEFVAHMQRVLEEKPHVMVAYAHMFYMALFAGGKVLRRMIVAKEGFFPVRKPAGDQEEARKMGTQMFMFPVEEGKGEELRKRFKEAVAIVEVGLDEDERAGKSRDREDCEGTRKTDGGIHRYSGGEQGDLPVERKADL